jgi:ABC-type multidrug transport system ATPase subunit
MGPSGSGKSSLLDILAGHEKSGAVKGNIEYFTSSVRLSVRSPTQRGCLSSHTAVHGVGYVYQDDRLLPMLTVRETILFSARVRLPRGLSDRAIQRRVDDVLALMDLVHIQSMLACQRVVHRAALCARAFACFRLWRAVRLAAGYACRSLGWFGLGWVGLGWVGFG